MKKFTFLFVMFLGGIVSTYAQTQSSTDIAVKSSPTSTTTISTNEVRGFLASSIDGKEVYEQRITTNVDVVKGMKGVESVTFKREKMELEITYNNSLTNAAALKSEIIARFK